MNHLTSVYLPSSCTIFFSEDHIISLFLHHCALSLSLVIPSSNQRTLFFVLFLASFFHTSRLTRYSLATRLVLSSHCHCLSRITRHSSLQRLCFHSLPAHFRLTIHRKFPTQHIPLSQYVRRRRNRCFFASTPIVDPLGKTTDCMHPEKLHYPSPTHGWSYGDTCSFPLHHLRPIYLYSYSLFLLTSTAF